MNLRDLRYLVAVAEHRHFGRAAEACFVSQPTLSTQLKKLEEFLGVTLVERNNRQVMLTPVGESIVAQAERVLRESNQLVGIAEAHRDPYGGDFRLGIIPTIAPYLLPKVLGPLRKTFPNLRLQLTESQTAVLTTLLKGGELDAAILALPIDDDHIESALLYREPFFMAVSRQHGKAKKKSVSLTDLDGEDVLLLEDGHCLRDQALAVCNSNNAVENTNFRATSIETLRQIGCGQRWHYANAGACDGGPNGRHQLHPVQGQAAFARGRTVLAFHVNPGRAVTGYGGVAQRAGVVSLSIGQLFA